MSEKRRVVITGVGPVTPIGIGRENFWTGVTSGRSGAGPVTRFDASAYATKFACEIKDFNAVDFVTPQDQKRMDLYSIYAMASAKLALEDAGLVESPYPPEQFGCIIGSGQGGIGTLEQQYQVMQQRGPGRVSPFLIPMIIVNMAAGNVAIRWNLQGPNTCVATACASGTHAIGDAFRVIQRGEATAMLAGGAEACITPLCMAGFCSIKAMSTRNDDPEHASRPFDRDRDGFVMGEGAGLVVLEEYESAKKRGANIYAEVVGYGMSCDAHHMTAPKDDGSGVGRAIRNAVKESGLSAEAYGYYNAHGTSTPLNDKFETAAVKVAFGDHARKIMVSSTKSMTGHLIGAAGGVETIVVAMTVARGVVPPTIHYENPDPDCDLDYVPNVAREAEIKAAVNTSLGFGGHNAVLCVKKL